MDAQNIDITLVVNGASRKLSVGRDESLLNALRRLSYFSVKYGCEDGTCGVCSILLNGEPVRSCKIKAADAVGQAITTLEGLSQNSELHPIQRAFVETGAIQCGFCTPAQILAAKALLDKNPAPTEAQIRQALNSVLCRCTGYVRMVEAVQRAAALLRGESVGPVTHLEQPLPADLHQVSLPEAYYRRGESRDPLPPLIFTPPDYAKMQVVGKPEVKVDGVKLAQGKPVFTDDFRLEGMLYGALLTSPHAHARIKRIDASRARALAGVHAVLTYQDIPRVKYASGGQSYPQPLPYDQVCLDEKVRHEGDRVAVVAAETPELAEEALKLIEVEYEILHAVVDPLEAMKEGAPVIHDEADTAGIYQANRNIVHHIEATAGDVEASFAEADHIFTGEYRTPK
jgi:putative selenate reductase molybdopterin-binding subunit